MGPQHFVMLRNRCARRHCLAQTWTPLSVGFRWGRTWLLLCAHLVDATKFVAVGVLSSNLVYWSNCEEKGSTLMDQRIF